MTATLNVTHGGLSRDVCQLDYETGDTDVVRIAEESLELSPGALQYFVVDRFDTPEGRQTRPTLDRRSKRNCYEGPLVC